MPTIRTHIDSDTYKRLARDRRRAGLPSISALFLKKCDALTDTGEAAEIVRLALRKAKGQDGGFEFRLRDLFPSNQWEKFSKGARLRAGKMFHEKVSAATDGIRASRKSSSNHQYYVVA